MTVTTSEKIQLEINKLKFFAKRNQQEQKITHSQSLNRTAEICFGIPSWSFVKNKFFSETYDDKNALLLRIGACNFALNSKHISNFEYAFHYWVFMGKPSADTILLNSSRQDLKIFEKIFKFMSEDNNICSNFTVSNSEKNDLLAFRDNALEFSFNVNYIDESLQIESAVFAEIEEADAMEALAEAEEEKRITALIAAEEVKALEEEAARIEAEGDDEIALAYELNELLNKIDEIPNMSLAEILNSPRDAIDFSKTLLESLNSIEE